MKLDRSPLFRKVVSPWYDSVPFCLVISILAAHVFYFSTVGIGVAMGHHQYEGYCWVPITLMILSGILMVTNMFRVLSRMVNRSSEEE